MANIKKICKKAKERWKKLNFREMEMIANYFGRIEPKEGSIYNIYYPADEKRPTMQLHKPHGGRKEVPIKYKKEFMNIFADVIDEEVE